MKTTKGLVIQVCITGGLLAFGAVAFASPPPQPAAHSNVPAADAHVDINTANLDQLMKVPGLPRTWAERIIRYRPYRAKNELLDRGVVTSQVYEHIKDHIIAHREKQ